MKKKLLLVLLIFILFLLLQGINSSFKFQDFLIDQWSVLTVDEREVQQALFERFGVRVVADMGTEAIPEYLRQEPSNARARPGKPAQVARYLVLLEKELGKYPAVVIRENLSTVYLFDYLEFHGVQYGGTFINDSIYLTACPVSRGCDDQYLAELFHHELSSVFWRNYEFPADRWQAINPPGFKYQIGIDGIVSAIQDGEGTIYQDGFLASYGRSTMENDFNLYAQTLFTDSNLLCALAKQYSRIRAKVDLVTEFYQTVSPEFSSCR